MYNATSNLRKYFVYRSVTWFVMLILWFAISERKYDDSLKCIFTDYYIGHDIIMKRIYKQKRSCPCILKARFIWDWLSVTYMGVYKDLWINLNIAYRFIPGPDLLEALANRTQLNPIELSRTTESNTSEYASSVRIHSVERPL